jgi:hypothetical protein
MIRGLKTGYLRPGEGLAVLCRCGRRRVLGDDQLRQVFGDAPLDEVGSRFRCKGCGTRPPLDVWVTWIWVGDFDKEGRPKRD